MRKTTWKEPAVPDRMQFYFRGEWLTLLLVTVSGICYNAGMVAVPWFEGQLAQMLCDIIGGKKGREDMTALAVCYLLVIAFVSVMRYGKRFYVRRFANNVNRSMKRVMYRNLIHKSPAAPEQEQVGGLMTKAISDVDACAEGMRKFTTELFDTGVLMLSYLALLLRLDWRLTLLACIFPPLTYFFAGKMKRAVSESAAAWKESTGRLNGATLDRVSGALTYRVLGAEQARNAAYEAHLCDYEKKAVRAAVLDTTLQPLYQVISTAGMILVLWFGAKNVRGSGWSGWDIAAFTTFLTCFGKLAVKSASVGKLFNAIQKARVSWGRIQPFLGHVPVDAPVSVQAAAPLTAAHLTVLSADGTTILQDVCFSAQPGQVVGVTGPVAGGKSMLGRAFLCEQPYGGSLRLGGQELSALGPEALCGTVAYLGHEPSLLQDSIAENVLLGRSADLDACLRTVCMDREVAEMPEGVQTRIGDDGLRLSGGQQARIALARTLCDKRPLLVLDDPFAALDCSTERQVMQHLRAQTREAIVLLISHRLYLFPQLDKVLWVENGTVTESTHAALMRTNAAYRALFEAQTGGAAHEEA